jgi:cold shock protein
MRVLRMGNPSVRLRPRANSKKVCAMISGTVKFFNSNKGFGFISPDDGSKDAFVHISAVENAGMSTLVEGQKLSYELENGRDGKVSATNLQAAD